MKNTRDESFSVTDGNPSTNAREKGTDTSVYLNLTKARFQGTVRVSIYGCNGSNQKNCTIKRDSYEVEAGKKYMLFNTVHECNFPAAKLVFSGLNGRTVEGVWSPDSVPESGCIELR